MKKWYLLGVMLLLAIFALTGCGAPQEPEAEPTPTPVPTQAPTQAAATVEPTISPRPMSGTIDWPEDPTATLLSIDPINKPTPVPIEFKPYYEYESAGLGIAFEIPEYWDEPYMEGTNTLIVEEPINDIRSGAGIPSSVTISVSVYNSAQTITEATAELNSFMDRYRQEYDSLSVSQTSNNKMLGEQGVYVTYWVDVPINPEDENSAVVKMRGRCLVVPKDKRLYMLRYLCPVSNNTDYEKVYKQIRDTIREL